MKLLSKIKVDKKFKPIHFKDRVPVSLIIGNDYFVSFGSNNVYPCVLKEIHEPNSERMRISIDIPAKPLSKKGYIDSDGKLSHDWKSTHILFPDEIGLTAEQAVQHQVTM